MADREREVLEKQIKCLSNLISTHKQLSAQEAGGGVRHDRTRNQRTSALAAQSRHRYTWNARTGGANTTVTSSTHKLVTQATAAAIPTSGHMTVTTATAVLRSASSTSGGVPVSRSTNQPPGTVSHPTSLPTSQGPGRHVSHHASASSGSNVIRTTAATQTGSQYRWTPSTAVASGVKKPLVPPASTAVQKPGASVVQTTTHPVVTTTSVKSVPTSTGHVVATKYSLKKVSSEPAVLSRTVVSARVQPSTSQAVSRFQLRKAGSVLGKTGSELGQTGSVLGKTGFVPSSLQTHSRTVDTAGPSGVVTSRYKLTKTTGMSGAVSSKCKVTKTVSSTGSSHLVSSRYKLSKVTDRGTNKGAVHKTSVKGKTPSPKVLVSKHRLRRQPSAAKGSGASKKENTPGLQGSTARISKKSPAGFVTMGKYKLRAKRTDTPGARTDTPGERRGGRKPAGASVSRFRLVKAPSADRTRSSEDKTRKFPSQDQLRWTRSGSSGVMAERHQVTDNRRGTGYVIPGTVGTPGLGRRVSRYKIVKSSFAPGSGSKRSRPDPRAARYYVKTASGKLLVKGGVVYKLSSRRLTRASPLSNRATQKTVTGTAGKPSGQKVVKVNIRGEKFLMDGSGKTLTRVRENETPGASTNETAGIHPRKEPSQARGVSRVVIRGVTYIRTAPGKLVRSPAANKVQEMASRAVQRSILTSQSARYRKISRQAAARQFCMFYNRFGRCNRGDGCPYIHDPDKVAVCTRFLRGTCPVKDCPFSHKVAPDKMPVCSYFLRGVCNRGDCPYSHVYVGRKAQVCQDFVNGYCPRGKECLKKHTLDCPDFSATGACPRGRRCRMVHRKRREKRKHQGEDEEEGGVMEEQPSSSLRPTEESSDSEAAQDQDEPPRKLARLPAFISLREEQTSGGGEGVRAQGTAEHRTNQGQDKLPAFPAQPAGQSEGRVPSKGPAERLQIRPRFLDRPRKGAGTDGQTDGPTGE